MCEQSLLGSIGNQEPTWTLADVANPCWTIFTGPRRVHLLRPWSLSTSKVNTECKRPGCLLKCIMTNGSRLRLTITVWVVSLEWGNGWKIIVSGEGEKGRRRRRAREWLWPSKKTHWKDSLWKSSWFLSRLRCMYFSTGEGDDSSPTLWDIMTVVYPRRERPIWSRMRQHSDLHELKLTEWTTKSFKTHSTCLESTHARTWNASLDCGMCVASCEAWDTTTRRNRKQPSSFSIFQPCEGACIFVIVRHGHGYKTQCMKSPCYMHDMLPRQVYRLSLIHTWTCHKIERLDIWRAQ